MELFFICGTGRCGTTVLKRILSKHQKVFAFPFESRFIIDPDGVVDLYESLLRSWSPYMVDTKIKRFEVLMMRLYKTSVINLAWLAVSRILNRNKAYLESPPYARMSFRRYNINIMKHLKELESKLSVYKYNGSWVGNTQVTLMPSIKFSPPVARALLASSLREFIEKIVDPILLKRNATHWCEDSPFSILHAESILEILPQSKFIHVYRDPRDVIASYKQQPWAPRDIVLLVEFYKSIIQKIFEVIENMPENSLMEVPFERLLKHPKEEILKIKEFIGLQPGNSLFQIDLKKSHSGRWKREFSTEEQAYVRTELEPVMQRLDYSD